MSAPWILDDRDGLVLALCRPLAAVPGIGHAFATRRGDGGTDLDAGSADAPDDRAVRMRAQVACAAGLGGLEPILLRQVHGAAVVDVEQGPGPVEGDAAVWSGRSPRFAAAVRTADCVPILVARLDGEGGAAVHGGWRGITAGILDAVLRDLAGRGIPASSLIAAVGPAIGPCCYEVGDEVVRGLEAVLPPGRAWHVVRRDFPGGRPRVDLKAAAAVLLKAAGVPSAGIHVAPWCTGCRPDLFHSFRRDGAEAGRMLATIGPGRP